MEKKESYIKTTRSGEFSGNVTRFSIAGVEIDNYANRKIYRNGELIEEIDETRELPIRIKPPTIHPPPDQKARLILIDYENPFWTLNLNVKRDITCWKVVKDGNTTLYDAITGKEIGKGIPMPTDKAISLSGYHTEEQPDPWQGYRDQAVYWFNKWGFNTWSVFAPLKGTHGDYISNAACTYRFALAHGSSYSFMTRAGGYAVSAADITSWLLNRDKMTFAFLGHCGGMDYTGEGTLSYAFRKGSLVDTVTIGYTHMSTQGEYCWPNAFNWQEKLYQKVDTGVTWKEAFDYAQACYPECEGIIKFVGDERLRLEQGSEDMTLNINSNPQGQEVLIDNVNVGNTPITKTVTCADHNIMLQPSGVVEEPDLRIEDVWTSENTVSYKIKNIGGEVAGSSHTKLKVDSVVKETKVEGGLNPGQSREGSFAYSWECGGTEDVIEVIGDCDGEVAEGNEGNNSIEKTFECSGNGGVDLIPIDIFYKSGYIGIKVKNQGTEPSVFCYHFILFKVDGNWIYKQKGSSGTIAPGATVTCNVYRTWPPAGTEMKLVVDASHHNLETDENNNDMEVTA